MTASRKRIQQVRWIMFLASVTVLVMSGCGLKSDRTDKPSDDWSRGLWLGTTRIKQPVALQVDAHRHVHMVWCGHTADDEDVLHYAQLDEQAQVLVPGIEPLGISLPNPRRPQLLVDGKENLHLAWLSRDEDQQRLYHTLISQDGQPTQPLLLSRETEDVDGFQMYLSPKDEVSFIWSSQPRQGTGMEPELELKDEQAGIFHRALGDASPPTLLIPQGIDPSVLVGNSGTTHLVWLYEREEVAVRDIYYATLEGPRVVPDGGQKLTDFGFSESGTYHGPLIGADTSTIYVIWSVQSLGGGFTPSAARTFYVSFERGQATLTDPSSIELPAGTAPEYADYASPFGYSKLVLLSPRLSNSDFVNAPATVQRQESELPVALSLTLVSRASVARPPEAEQLRFEDSVVMASSGVQLAVAVLSRGKPIGYQLASNTPDASVFSTLVADPNSSLHLAWIDTAGFRQYNVYYASTSPDARRWLDRTSGTDVLLGAADLLWGIVSGIGLIPIAAIWNILPLMWIVLFYIFSGREYLEQIGTKIGLLVSVVIYFASKLVLLPGLSAGTPFLYQLPRRVASALTIALPLSILFVALGAIFLYARRARRATLFKAYFVFALTDGLLTAVLYAPQFLKPA